MTSAKIAPKDQIKVTQKSDQWYYAGKATGLGWGGHDKSCDTKKYSCAGGKKYGYGSLQAAELKKAIANGGTHPAAKCKVMPESKGKWRTYWCGEMTKAKI